MDKLRMQTANKADENFRKLAALFPNAVTETIDENGEVVRAIDKDVLMQEINTKVVDGKEERYQFTWPDKKKSVLLANAPINKTLRPVREDETVPTGADSEGKPYCSTGSVDFDTTENLYIEGDNLEVLKLLQETYLGKIKMIYIDPPYNTGNDFVYKDDFAQSTDEYLANSGQFDEEGNRLVQNTESNGRFHTDWLNMLFPRLRLAKDLLSIDGVVFISIDDSEVDNLRKICDEVFGRNNFVADLTVVNNLKGRNDKKYIARANERLIMYVKSQEYSEHGLELADSVLKEYKEKDKNGCYRLLELRKRGGPDTRKDRPNMYYPFYVNPETGNVSLEQDNEYLANTMIINITTKKQEYGVLQAVGMTNKQLNLSLQIQGLIFTVGTICVALAAGLPLGYALFSYAKHNGIFGMNVYHVPLIPILVMILLVGILQIVLSLVLSSNLKKETLVERIRYQG